MSTSSHSANVNNFPAMPSANAPLSTESHIPPLKLNRATFAKISPIPYLTAHLSPSNTKQPLSYSASRGLTPTRPNGRTPSAFLPPTCTTSSLTHCAGSAVVRLGDTAVVCGVQAEILLSHDVPDPPRQHTRAPEQTTTSADAGAAELAGLNLLVPNVDLATGCSPAHLPGTGPPSAEAQTLSHRLLALLLSSRLLSIEDLRITHTPSRIERDADEGGAPREETVAYWTLYMSIHILSLSGGAALFDAVWASLVAALRDVRLPRAWWDEDIQGVLCSDAVSEARRLRLRGCPVACTWGVFVGARDVHGGTVDGKGDMVEVRNRKGKEHGQDALEDLFHAGREIEDGRKVWLLAEPDGFEDPLCKEIITIVVDCSSLDEDSMSDNFSKTRILKIEKGGGGTVGPKDIRGLIRMAEERWKDWEEVLRSCVR